MINIGDTIDGLNRPFRMKIYVDIDLAVSPGFDLTVWAQCVNNMEMVESIRNNVHYKMFV